MTTTFLALLGLLVGSFLNVVIHRVPRGESVVSPPSACPRCGSRIRNRHNVPVISWVLLKGRCADCGESISVRYPLVELGTGMLFVLVAIRFSDRPALLAAYLTFAAISVALGAIDLDVHRLPDVLVLPAYAVLAALLALDMDAHALTRAAGGAGALFAFFLLIAVAVPGAMGFGDVKLAGVVGAMTAYVSWGSLLAGAFCAFLAGALVGVALLVSRRAGRKTAMPFGPFMLLGAWAAIFGAGHLGDAYLSLVS